MFGLANRGTVIDSVSSRIFTAALALALVGPGIAAAQTAPKFKVLAFCPMSGDAGHDSYIHEANKFFPKLAAQNGFQYDSTKNWSDCNPAKLAQYKLVMFLDNRPDQQAQRDAFKAYMDNGGAWIGCHFAAFALNNSAVPQNWDWYHNDFIGSGEYKSNTWAPTPAFLKVEDGTHPFMKGLPGLFKASANEWYRWNNDLKANPNIKILASIDPSSFPLGTGPKPEEIWHSGYYPVVWTNIKYKMLYLNMGHNDIDYSNGNKDKSQTFGNTVQDQMMLNAILTLTGTAPTAISAGPREAATGAAKVTGFRFDGGTMTIAAPSTGGFKAAGPPDPGFGADGRRAPSIRIVPK
ncbi:MAG: hypothetical protein JWP91_3104 [Fibrobacteres bacterium]|nr:hypothetical protein [Fibrobacterota bacterium]